MLSALVCAAVLLTGWLAPVQPAHALFDNGGFETGDTSGWQSSHGLNYGLQGSQPFSASSIVIGTGGQRLGGVLGATFDPRAPPLDLPRAGHYTAKVNDELGGRHINALNQSAVITAAALFEQENDPATIALFEALRAWRAEEAKGRSVPAYTVFADTTLRSIAVVKPATRQQLALIRGVGPVKIEAYSEAVLGIVREQAG